MNDFFDSLKDIKKEMMKEQKSDPKEPKKEVKAPISKEEAVAFKEKKLTEEFLSYVKDCDIRKI